MGYSCRIENEADFAKARVEDVNASYKDLAEVCGNIRRWPADAAVSLLEEAKAGKRPLRYRSHNTRMAHRKELMGQKGRWPMKAAGIVLKCLQSAIANAKEKGLSEELIVAYACANKKNSHMRYSSKGRRNTSKLETARVEVVLREKAEEKKKRVEEEKKKAGKVKEAEKAKKGESAKPSPVSEKKVAKTSKIEKEVKPASDKVAEKETDKLKMKSREELIENTKHKKIELTGIGTVSDSGDNATIEMKKEITSAKETAPKPAEKKPEAKEAPAKKAEDPKPKTESPKPEAKDIGDKKEVA